MGRLEHASAHDKSRAPPGTALSPYQRGAAKPCHSSHEGQAQNLGSLLNVRNQQDSKKKKPGAKDFWRLALLVIAVIAVVQELRKAPEDRTWQGKVGEVIPYDFRKPTAERFRKTYWNPEGPMMGGKAWGIGWAPNFGAIRKLFDTAE